MHILWLFPSTHQSDVGIDDGDGDVVHAGGNEIKLCFFITDDEVKQATVPTDHLMFFRPSLIIPHVRPG
jgi:hypothetical protein